ncbi:MAG: hypothetical protein AB7O38_24660, partial [Pirellulaceae bacterium]
MADEWTGQHDLAARGERPPWRRGSTSGILLDMFEPPNRQRDCDPRVPRARQLPWPLIVIRTVRGVCVAAGILGFFLAFETDAPSAPLLRSLNVL